MPNNKHKKSGAEGRQIKKAKLMKESASGCKSMFEHFQRAKEVPSTETSQITPDTNDEIDHDEAAEPSCSSTGTAQPCVSSAPRTGSITPAPTSRPTTSPDTNSNRPTSDETSTDTNLQPTGTVSGDQGIDQVPSQTLYDIGLYVGTGMHKNQLTDDVRMKLLNEHWVPPLDFEMPHSVRSSKGNTEKRFLRHEHLQRCHYLAFSKTQSGLFCRVCALFGPTASDITNQALKRLVSEPLKRYDHLFGKDGYLTTHEETQYHKNATLRASQFKLSMAKNIDIRKIIDDNLHTQAQENRRRIEPIVKTVLLCGRQNIPLRGHRDDGRIVFDEWNESDVSAPGSNFRALLHFRVDAGDETLENHLKNCASNATYISKETQNQLINAAGDVITKKIVDRISSARYFTIMADETTDISRKEQLSLVVRYVDTKGMLLEDFLGFIHVSDLTGRALAETILQRLQELGIDCDYLVGQGYDGAANMSGIMNGVQAVIREKHPHALYIHCASHALNLTLANAATIPAIRNAQGTISEVINFVNNSAKRSELFATCVDQMDRDDVTKRKLKTLCETRWVERHDSVITFHQLYPAILEFLQQVSQQHSRDSATKARTLMSALSDTEFLVSLAVLHKMLALTKSLSVQLQKVNLDLHRASNHINVVAEEIKALRANADDKFRDVWACVEQLATEAEVELRLPRIAKRQRHRANVPASTPQEYFRKSIYVPFLDHMIQQFEARFEGRNAIVMRLSCLLPKFVRDYEMNDVQPVFEEYRQFLSSVDEAAAEFSLWKRLCSSTLDVNIDCAVGALAHCDEQMYPNIHTMLRIMITLPVTTASAERSFSTLRRLKTYLRSSMRQDRLTGLALLNVHKDITVEPSDVIDVFARSRRRLNFVL